MLVVWFGLCPSIYLPVKICQIRRWLSKRIFFRKFVDWFVFNIIWSSFNIVCINPLFIVIFHHKKWIIIIRLKFLFHFFYKFDLPIFYIFFQLYPCIFIPVFGCFLPTIVFNRHFFQISTDNCTMNLNFFCQTCC